MDTVGGGLNYHARNLEEKEVDTVRQTMDGRTVAPFRAKKDPVNCHYLLVIVYLEKISKSEAIGASLQKLSLLIKFTESQWPF